jgi:5-methylcytosine-specific restriction protein A
LETEPTGGPWFTGYVEHEGNCFIFCNVGIRGRTGHDYANHFDGDRLVWFGKGPSKLEHESIQKLLYPKKNLYIFYRFNDRDQFTYAGIGRPHQVFDVTPVKVVWDFLTLCAPPNLTEHPVYQINSERVVEGTAKTVTTKVYERDRGARLKCIGQWGWQCFVCQFDFASTYGDLGEGFIHVHHLKPLSEIGEAYMLDPISDLRPVCPNCHAMLHRHTPALSIEALQVRMRRD